MVAEERLGESENFVAEQLADVADFLADWGADSDDGELPQLTPPHAHIQQVPCPALPGLAAAKADSEPGAHAQPVQPGSSGFPGFSPHAAGVRGRRDSGVGAWNELEDGLRYRFSEAHQVVEVEHFNGGRSPSAVVILTHGLGDSAHGWVQPALQLCSELPWTRWVLPSAPKMPVTLNGGKLKPAWYDIVELSDRAAEHCDGIEQSHETLLRLAEKELDSLQQQDPAGPDDGARLVLAGFSQGGAMSLYTALRWPSARPPPAGVLCMSGYLPLPDTHEAELSAVGSGTVLKTPMLLCHGDADPVVRPDWSTATFDRCGACMLALTPLQTTNE